jgi:hypothetical protein
MQSLDECTGADGVIVTNLKRCQAKVWNFVHSLAVLLEAYYCVKVCHLTFTSTVIPSRSEWSLQQCSEPCSVTLLSIRYVLLFVRLLIQETCDRF